MFEESDQVERRAEVLTSQQRIDWFAEVYVSPADVEGCVELEEGDGVQRVFEVGVVIVAKV